MSPPCRPAADHPADQPPTKVRRPPLIPPGRSALGAGPWRAARPPPFPHEQNMTAPTILGIDPGAHGAIAVRDEGGGLLKVLDMPSTPEANGSRQLIDGESKGKNHVISIDPESPIMTDATETFSKRLKSSARTIQDFSRERRYDNAQRAPGSS
jgi:hypothetical protein